MANEDDRERAHREAGSEVHWAEVGDGQVPIPADHDPAAEHVLIETPDGTVHRYPNPNYRGASDEAAEDDGTQQVSAGEAGSGAQSMT